MNNLKNQISIEKENEKSKDFPLLKIIVFSFYGLLIYCIYYLIKFGI
jgi:hypothetical protein